MAFRHLDVFDHVAGLGECTANGCPSVEEPVCGMNGRTYLNRCDADAERVPVQRKGACDIDNCPKVFAPVCGPDGQTYDNACDAEKAGPIKHLKKDGEWVDVSWDEAFDAAVRALRAQAGDEVGDARSERRVVDGAREVVVVEPGGAEQGAVRRAKCASC